LTQPSQSGSSVHGAPPHDGVFSIARTTLELAVISIFVATFLVQPSRIPTESMVPTLQVGDFLLVDKQAFAPAGLLDKLLPPAAVQRGDLVVFHFPVDGSVTLVKRVVALPGDRLHLHGGKVYLNGGPLSEPYAFYTPSRYNNFRDEFPSLREADPNVELRWWIELRRDAAEGELTVPAGSYFVLGDNRNDSEDSRYWGFVPRQAIIGRPLLVYFSGRTMQKPGALERLRAALNSIHVPR